MYNYNSLIREICRTLFYDRSHIFNCGTFPPRKMPACFRNLSTMSLRDCQAWKDEGLPLSTTSNEAAKWFDSSLRQFVAWREDQSCEGLKGSFSKMTKADPDFVMGKVLKLGIDVLSGTRSIRTDPSYIDEISQLKKVALSSTSLSQREVKHVKAVLLGAEGNLPQACDQWESILLEYPTDIMALKLANITYVYRGESRQIKDSVARVLPSWNKNNPLYNYLKGMYAFGLEECNFYPIAMKVANEALSVNNEDAWASHAIAHCYEMENRVDEGIAFLESTEKGWSQSNFIKGHIYWHLALFYLEKEDHNRVQDLIVNYMVPSMQEQGLAFLDLASILYRLKLLGLKMPKDALDAALGFSRKHINDHTLAFIDTHYAMTFSCCNRDDMAREHLNSLCHFLSECRPMSVNSTINEKYGASVINAIIAFDQQDYNAVVDLLFPIRSKLWKLGYSHAQDFAQREKNAEVNQSSREICDKIRSLAHIRRSLTLLHNVNETLKQNYQIRDRSLYSDFESHLDSLPEDEKPSQVSERVCNCRVLLDILGFLNYS